MCKWRHGLRSIGGKSLSKRFQLQIVLLFVLSSLLSSCSSASRQPAKPETSQEETLSSTPPFKTIEPEKYRGERVFTYINSDGATTVTRSSIARDGDLRREDLERGGHKIVLLDNYQTRMVLLPESMIYSEISLTDGSVGEMDLLELGSSPERLLHQESNSTTSYQKLGSEQVGERTATKYRAVVNNSTASNVSKLEALIWIDESLGMPIKSESKSSDGRQVVMELTNISLEVESNLFKIPEGYKKVAATEITQRLNGK